MASTPSTHTATAKEALSALCLTAPVVGSMVGAGGLYSLLAKFSSATGVLGALIAWLISGVGMLMLAFFSVSSTT